MAKLYFYYSTMNAGKTTTLLQSAHNYIERGMRALLITSSIDDRSYVGNISSRVGISKDADIVLTSTTDIVEQYERMRDIPTTPPISCILVDESQFLQESHINQLIHMVDKYNIPVMCYGLRTDFQGKLFSGSKLLLANADELIEIKSICECGKKATHTVRYDSNGNVCIDGDQVHIGGNDTYTAYCRKHFNELTAS